MQGTAKAFMREDITITPMRIARHVGALLLLGVLPGRCKNAPLPYPEQIAAHRAEYDQFMRTSAESPVPVEKRATFPPITYFAIDEAYRVPAALEPAQGGAPVPMPTSTGQVRQMRRVGTLSFTLKGHPMTLGAFVEANETDMKRLFVPFGDLTNGTETYPGGRYIDLDRTPSGIYDLDFNRAYHPYCFYNSSYDCPYPPAENRLKVPVRAGERLPRPNR